MDFDDLLLETIKRFQQADGEEKKKWRNRYAYLLVDEFQDINPIQYKLMKCWNEDGRELFVIGDPDQSIYGFQGRMLPVFLDYRRNFLISFPLPS